jgi:SAM-dependent methyltransferase
VHGQAAQPSDAEVYSRYERWASGKATTDRGTEAMALQADVMAAYRKALTEEGVPAAEADRRVVIIRQTARRIEADNFWNRALTAPTPTFNIEPNAFLVRTTKGVHPGTALDYGMGQGRNAIYLAQQGWTVTGFDPAAKAVEVAQEQAHKLGVKLSTQVVGDETFEFGKDRWDLIVISYVGFRRTMPRIFESLKPGGLVVVEAFHRDSLKNGPIGGGVVFDTNELLKLFDRFRVLNYEDAEDKSDFGKGTNRVVRLVAQKPS